jgi:histone H3/H4
VVVAALQAAAEAFLVETFEGAGHLALHAGRDELLPADIRLLRQLRRADQG